MFFRASSYARLPSTFLAETAGGVCRNSPRNGSRRRSSSSASSTTSALLADGLPGAIVGVGGPAEAHQALVDLVAARVELRQPRGASDHQRQHAGGDRVQRAQVPDLLGVGDAAHLAHHVVRGPALGLVDYDDSVQFSPCAFRAVQMYPSVKFRSRSRKSRNGRTSAGGTSRIAAGRNSSHAQAA